MGGKLGGLPESEVGGQWFRVPLEEFVRTACLISEVTSGTEPEGAVNKL